MHFVAINKLHVVVCLFFTVQEKRSLLRSKRSNRHDQMEEDRYVTMAMHLV